MRTLSWKTKLLMVLMGLSFLYAVEYIEMEDSNNLVRSPSTSTINTENSRIKSNYEMRKKNRNRNRNRHSILSFSQSSFNRFIRITAGILIALCICISAMAIYNNSVNRRYAGIENFGFDSNKSLNGIDKYPNSIAIYKTPQSTINKDQVDISNMKYIDEFSIVETSHPIPSSTTEIIDTSTTSPLHIPQVTLPATSTAPTSATTTTSTTSTTTPATTTALTTSTAAQETTTVLTTSTAAQETTTVLTTPETTILETTTLTTPITTPEATTSTTTKKPNISVIVKKKPSAPSTTTVKPTTTSTTTTTATIPATIPATTPATTTTITTTTTRKPLPTSPTTTTEKSSIQPNNATIETYSQPTPERKTYEQPNHIEVSEHTTIPTQHNASPNNSNMSETKIRKIIPMNANGQTKTYSYLNQDDVLVEDLENRLLDEANEQGIPVVFINELVESSNNPKVNMQDMIEIHMNLKVEGYTRDELASALENTLNVLLDDESNHIYGLSMMRILPSTFSKQELRARRTSTQIDAILRKIHYSLKLGNMPDFQINTNINRLIKRIQNVPSTKHFYIPDRFTPFIKNREVSFDDILEQIIVY
ncbi:hypothetical protein NEFER03_1135 [Nematocida sp. LUAm3]|nr:hypothetical protein NEFER03_1135 [Nematocida sp. LUAm3]KAI5176329.1 hypothetical protein NEFER02_2117 [Nematocida sp. LUAm2]KAI5178240.1 hypothetical protein NEFER01_1407 [Nematocida sp. LUAm1]